MPISKLASPSATNVAVASPPTTTLITTLTSRPGSASFGPRLHEV